MWENFNFNEKNCEKKEQWKLKYFNWELDGMLKILKNKWYFTCLMKYYTWKISFGEIF
jgi:hypothetical protein